MKTFIYKNIAKRRVDVNFFKNCINTLYKIQEKLTVSKEDLKKELKISEKDLDLVIKILNRETFLNISSSKQEEKIFLTPKGVSYLLDLKKNFSVVDFTQISLESKVEDTEFIPPFLGYMIGGKHGKQIQVTEVSNGILSSILKTEDSYTEVDYELIPLFISALEKFSDKINIKNLIGFTLKGTNIKIKTLKFDLATITLFMRHDTKYRQMKTHIQAWFKVFIEENKEKFKISIDTGNLEILADLRVKGKEWLKNLNKKYRIMDLNLDLFETEQTKALFQKLDDLAEDKDLLSPKMLKNINKLKESLIKAVLNEDLNSIKNITKKINYLNLTLFGMKKFIKS